MKLNAWRLLHSRILRRIRRKVRPSRSRYRSRQTLASSVSTLSSSCSAFDAFTTLYRHQWSLRDGHYLLLASISIWALYIMDNAGTITKGLLAMLLLLLLIPPFTSQFFLPFFPITTWLLLLFSSRFISSEYRPAIWVRVLPSLENILYGANLSNILSAHKYILLDVLAWFPYGISHFGAPVLCSALLFTYGPPGTLPVFARTFGYMNLLGVIIQLVFPCSAPWYEDIYGFTPADYSMKGSPAGLAAIDKLFGIDMYTSSFTASPLVFGAFPSLHAACASLEALFMSHVFPNLRPLFTIYVLWICWATMYLSHHYAVDLIGGSILAASFFFLANAKFLPRLQGDKTFRWDYDFVELGDHGDHYATRHRTVFQDSFTVFDGGEWTIGSSIAVSSEAKSDEEGKFQLAEHGSLRKDAVTRLIELNKSSCRGVLCNILDQETTC